MTDEVGTRWTSVPLGTVLADLQPGFASGNHNSIGEGIPHFRPMNVSTDGRIERKILKYVDPTVGRPELRLRVGDVLFNNTNSPEQVGKTALFEGDDAPAFSNHMTRLRTDQERLDPSYLALRLHQAWREGWFAAHCNNHVSQASISRDVLRAFKIELPPLATQRAIAMLYRKLDASQASSSNHLAMSQHAIKRFRQSIFEAAGSGRLTADWRETHLERESVDELLVKHAASNMNHPVNKRRLKPVHGLALIDDSSEFPESWSYKHVRELVELRVILDIQDGNHGELYPRRTDFVSSGGVPFISAESVSDVIELRSAPRLSEQVAQSLRIGFAKANDVILTHNATVGRVAIIPPGTPDVVLSTSTTYYRVDGRVLLPEYLALFMRSSFFQRQLASIMEQTTRNQVPVTKQVELYVAVPPIEEQSHIVTRAGELLALGARIVSRIDVASTRVERSSQAILAKAFRGNLIVMDN